jgi:type I restriction enzyme S subunit
MKAEWTTKPLKHSCGVNRDTIGEGTRSNWEMQYLDISAVDSDGNVAALENYTFANAPSRARRRVRPGDTVISTVRTYLKAIAHFDQPPENLIASTGFAVLSPSRDVDSRFLWRAVQSHGFVSGVVANSEGVGYPAIAPSRLENLPISFPAIAAQRRIAAYLDEATGKVDRLVALRRRQMELLQEQRAALIQQAVTRGLNPRASFKDSGVPWIGQMPRDWQLLPLRAVLTERGEFNTDLRTTNFLSVLKDVGVVPYEEREASGNKKSDEMEKYKIIHPGDIVANRMNLIFGSVGLSAHFGCSSTEYYVLRARNDSVDTRFYGLIFQSKAFQRSLVGIGSGILAHRMRIYYEALKTVLLPVPSFSEQQKIVAHVEKENERCDALHRSYERQLALLAEYRAALIHECVTGQREVV